MEFKLMTPNEVTRSRRSALRQGNGGGRRDAARVALLSRVLRVRSLAKQFGLHLCDRAHLKAMTDGELHAYFHNLDDSIKRHVMSPDATIAQRWKLPDEMEAWEFIERIDQLRALKQARDTRRAHDRALPAQARPSRRAVV
jgi:hypothetical protein